MRIYICINDQSLIDSTILLNQFRFPNITILQSSILTKTKLSAAVIETVLKPVLFYQNSRLAGVYGPNEQIILGRSVKLIRCGIARDTFTQKEGLLIDFVHINNVVQAHLKVSTDNTLHSPPLTLILCNIML